VVEMAEVNDISCEVRRRRWNWLGHILRREGVNDCLTALGWTPEGQRARGRPKTTWRRTVEKERNKAGWKSWEVAKAVARNRECWPTGMTRNDDDDGISVTSFISTAGKKPRSDCPGQLNFALGQVKMDVWWSNGQVKLAPVVFLVDKP